MGYDVEEQKRAIMAAEQAVAVMDGKMRMKLKPDAKRALTNAILKSGAQDDLLFRNTPVRHAPPWWSMTGVLARAVLLWRRYVKLPPEDAQQSLSDIQAGVRRSGGITLVVALLVSLICGVIEFGAPGEVTLQKLRDKVRSISASGDIVVIAQDTQTANSLGQWPWPRRYDAALVDKLSAMGAKTIVFTQAYADPTDSENDGAFAKALDRARGKVWLGAELVQNNITGLDEALLPLPLFRTRSFQAHDNIWFDAFGYTRDVPHTEKILGTTYRSSASVLANYDLGSGKLRPDTAIEYKTIPTISMINVLENRVKPSGIAGKAVIVGPVFANTLDSQPILGQAASPVPSVYTRAIAAETIRNGAAKEPGWLPPLFAGAMISLACVLRRSRKERGLVILGGMFLLLALMLISDRLGWHFEMMPALLALTIIGVRDVVRGKEMALETSHPVSGLPNISGMKYLRNHESCAAAALKVERYTQMFGELQFEEQRALMLAVAARINIVCPDSVIHQGNDGLFVWLLKLNPDGSVPEIAPQLRALFTQPVAGLKFPYSVGIGVGVCSELDQTLAERVAVASHGARLTVFITLQSVQ